MTELKLFDYYCVRSDGTRGRCQNPAVGEGLRPFDCIEHLKLNDPPMAPMPDWVLFWILCSENFRGKYLEGSPIRKTESDPIEKVQDRIAEAERLGRNYRHFFPKRAYNGSPVFGKDGLREVGQLYQLRQEVEEAGYVLVNQHWYDKPGETAFQMGRKKLSFPKTQAIFVCGFLKASKSIAYVPDVTDYGTNLFGDLMQNDGFMLAHVHANAPDQNGEVLHSIELIGRRENAGSKCRLVPIFMDGMWYAVPRAVNALLREQTEAAEAV